MFQAAYQKEICLLFEKSGNFFHRANVKMLDPHPPPPPPTPHPSLYNCLQTSECLIQGFFQVFLIILQGFCFTKKECWQNYKHPFCLKIKINQLTSFLNDPVSKFSCGKSSQYCKFSTCSRNIYLKRSFS